MKRLVLVGAGHAHMEVLRTFWREAPRSVEVVLVSPEDDTPYAGMLPGLVAGLREWREAHIAVTPLARYASARFLRTWAVGIDADQKQIHTIDGEMLDYDILSLNMGSTPPVDAEAARARNGVMVKPVPTFLQVWDALVEEAQKQQLRIVVAGGGAGGVELTLAMHHRLQTLGGTAAACDLTLVTGSATIVPDYPAGVRARLMRALRAARIGVLTGVRVDCSVPDGLRLDNGGIVPAHCVVWATGAAPPRWLVDTTLALDDAGFLAVNDRLQSTSHGNVFAAGDMATIEGSAQPRSAASVIHQGPALARNLLLALEAKPLERFAPPTRTPILIGTGGKQAIGTWGPFTVAGEWIWRRKDRIDREFMARYSVQDVLDR